MSPDTAETKLLSPQAIGNWIIHSATRQSYLGLCEVDALNWAESNWRAQVGKDPNLTATSDLADRLYALARLALEDHNADSGIARFWYERIDEILWPADTFCEKTQLLTIFAYATWRQLRRSGEFITAQEWEGRIAALVVSQPAVAEFLALEANERSDQIALRFLSDPAVLLAAEVELQNAVNYCPSAGLRSAVFLDKWLSRPDTVVCSAEEHAYFRSRARTAVAVALKHVGRYRDAQGWLELARESCREIVSPECSLAFVEYVQLAIAYETRRYHEVAARAGALADIFENFGLQVYVARSRYVEGLALKELERDIEAVDSFALVASNRHSSIEPWMRGTALVGIAEISGRRGDYTESALHLNQAWLLIGDAAPIHALASFHGINAEVHRGQGNLSAAISAYRKATDTYAKGGMEGMASYLRVVLAETLVAAGREAEAAEEIFTALPSIERLNLFQEGIAAIALLRESVRRQRADPEALRILRLELQTMKEGMKS